ncbi:MAG: bifunctional DNA primase/polymerase, partial [Rhodoblastus sp.]|nr:bifunctional DNA primase/polymerase [Rhodoblastus sp.]
MSNDNDASLAAALAWSRRGPFKVFPIRANAKEPPLVKDWPARASSDEEAIRAMWREAGPGRHNIGCALGGGKVVADLDAKPGKRGFETQVALELLEPTLSVRTPNGRHCYYRGDARNAVDLAGPGSGLDVRASGGYVLAPGSIVDGRPYTLEDDAPIIDAPPRLRELLAAPRARQEATAAPVVDLDLPASLAAASAYLETAAP